MPLHWHWQWGETYNHVLGRTTNPYNRYMTPGGSSGGEGALVAMRGSPLGVGTDIGGYVEARSFLDPPAMFDLQRCSHGVHAIEDIAHVE